MPIRKGDGSVALLLLIPFTMLSISILSPGAGVIKKWLKKVTRVSPSSSRIMAPDEGDNNVTAGAIGCAITKFNK
jgi:hypothetical protein